MVTNLFSIFDPSSSVVFLPNWVSMLAGLMLIPMNFWLISSRWAISISMLTFSLLKEFSVLLKKMTPTIFFVSLFSFIILSNLLGLIPYVFTSSSHLVFSLSLALPLWLSYTLFQWVKHFSLSAAHLVPQSTPVYLMPFMVLVESISMIIRPLTLAVRLAANMIAGHLLMTLLSSTLISIPLFSQTFVMFTLITLLTLEIAVASIQAYVFVILSVLYASEI
uniref:ATP synthase subunit a n=1 Tax=Limnoria quadripunctata TaxID=161573 RepID=A0A023IWT8_LIMQU|nr:ATP synthase F0 subunit 6 [Limnoria quadripunctata]